MPYLAKRSPMVPGPSSQAVMPLPRCAIASATFSSSALRSFVRCAPAWQERRPVVREGEEEAAGEAWGAGRDRVIWYEGERGRHRASERAGRAVHTGRQRRRAHGAAGRAYAEIRGGGSAQGGRRDAAHTTARINQMRNAGGLSATGYAPDQGGKAGLAIARLPHLH